MAQACCTVEHTSCSIVVQTSYLYCGADIFIFYFSSFFVSHPPSVNLIFVLCVGIGVGKVKCQGVFL